MLVEYFINFIFMFSNKNTEHLNLKEEIRKALDSGDIAPEHMEMREQLKMLQQRVDLSYQINKNLAFPLNRDTFLKISEELWNNDLEKKNFLDKLSIDLKHFFWFLEIFKSIDWKKESLNNLYTAFPTTLKVKKILNLLLNTSNFENYISLLEITLKNPNVKTWFENVNKWNISFLQDMVNTEKYAISSLNKKKKIDIKDYKSIEDWVNALKNSPIDWWKSYLQVIEETLWKESWIFLWDIKLDDLLIKWDLIDTSNLDKINTKILREKDNLMNFRRLVEKDWEVFKTSIQKNYKMRFLNWEVKEINEKYDIYLNTIWSQILVIKDNSKTK